MSIYILNGSNSIPCIMAAENLSRFGRVIRLPACRALPSPEMYHADMRFCMLSDDSLICPPADCEGSAARALENSGIRIIPGSADVGGEYPFNIPYNVLRVGNISFHNIKYTDARLKEALTEYPRALYHINQGYAGCSSIAVPLSEHSFVVISSDKGVVSALSCLNVPGVSIHAIYFDVTDGIVLDGYDHGFIGGCCGFDREHGLIVCGKINGQLCELSGRFGFNIISVYDGPLTDIGGILVMYPDQ